MNIRIQELLKFEELVVLIPMNALMNYSIICRTNISHKNDVWVNEDGSGTNRPLCCFSALLICEHLDICAVEICAAKDTVWKWSMING